MKCPHCQSQEVEIYSGRNDLFLCKMCHLIFKGSENG